MITFAFGMRLNKEIQKLADERARKEGYFCASYYGCDIDRAKAFAMLRQAFIEDKVFEIHYIENEGVILHDECIGGGYFEMKLREKNRFEKTK